MSDLLCCTAPWQTFCQNLFLFTLFNLISCITSFENKKGCILSPHLNYTTGNFSGLIQITQKKIYKWRFVLLKPFGLICYTTIFWENIIIGPPLFFWVGPKFHMLFTSSYVSWNSSFVILMSWAELVSVASAQIHGQTISSGSVLCQLITVWHFSVQSRVQM